MRRAKAFEELYGQDESQLEVFVIGGAEIYTQVLDRVERIYLTEVQDSPQGDAYFPNFDRSNWIETDRQDREPESKDGPAFSFVLLDRKYL